MTVPWGPKKFFGLVVEFLPRVSSRPVGLRSVCMQRETFVFGKATKRLDVVVALAAMRADKFSVVGNISLLRIELMTKRRGYEPKKFFGLVVEFLPRVSSRPVGLRSVCMQRETFVFGKATKRLDVVVALAAMRATRRQ